MRGPFPASRAADAADPATIEDRCGPVYLGLAGSGMKGGASGRRRSQETPPEGRGKEGQPVHAGGQEDQEGGDDGDGGEELALPAPQMDDDVRAGHQRARTGADSPEQQAVRDERVGEPEPDAAP